MMCERKNEDQEVGNLSQVIDDSLIVTKSRKMYIMFVVYTKNKWITADYAGSYTRNFRHLECCQIQYHCILGERMKMKLSPYPNVSDKKMFMMM